MFSETLLEGISKSLYHNLEARQHFLAKNCPLLNLAVQQDSSENAIRPNLNERQQLLARLTSTQRAEEARIKEDYTCLLSLIDQHPYCLEQLTQLSIRQFTLVAQLAKTYSVTFSLLEHVLLPLEFQLEIGYVIALYNSYLDSDLNTPTLGMLVLMVAVLQAEVILLLRVLATLICRSPEVTPTKLMQAELLFVRFSGALHSYIGTDEPYFLSKKQRKILLLYRQEYRAISDDDSNSAVTVSAKQSTLQLIEKYLGIQLIGNNVFVEKPPQPRPKTGRPTHTSNKSITSANIDKYLPENNHNSKKTTSFYQKAKAIRYPPPPEIEGKISPIQINPPLKLLDKSNVSIFPVGYGPVDLMYKGYRVGIQETLSFTNGTFAATMTRVYCDIPSIEKTKDQSDTPLESSENRNTPAATQSGIDAGYAAFLRSKQSIDVPLLTKAQTSWIKSRWISAASYDPSDLQLLCLEQAMGSEVESALVEKQVDTEAIRHSITSWGDKCIKIALKEPLPKTWTPILTPDGRYVRFLDNVRGAIFSIHPEVREAQKRIDAQYKLLDKYMRLPSNSEITQAYELIKRLTATGFTGLDLIKSTSCLFKNVVQELNDLVTSTGKIITRWAPLYNTSNVNIKKQHDVSSAIKFNL